jgi:hypothetical protein
VGAFRASLRRILTVVLCGRPGGEVAVHPEACSASLTVVRKTETPKPTSLRPASLRHPRAALDTAGDELADLVVDDVFGDVPRFGAHGAAPSRGCIHAASDQPGG